MNKINIIFIFLFITSVLSSNLNSISYSLKEPKEIIIEGLVENPLKISYEELRGFPKVWEIVELWCVEGYKVVKFNWTGVPLIYLLSKAKFKENAKEIIFHAADGFTSSITLKEALDPTVILALEANGTELTKITSREGGIRIILPCRWGYKWVTQITKIEVIDYDYKGLWETLGYSDEGKMPACPDTTLSNKIFNLNLESYNIYVAGFTTGIIEKIDYNHNGKVLEIKINYYSSNKSLINLYLGNIENYSHIDLILDEKVNATVLKNQDIITILLDNIKEQNSIKILAYQNTNEEKNSYIETNYSLILTIIILALLTSILIYIYKIRCKK
ncbi:MAG: molybdopterin-dependent oxidoreductase [Nitrososphaeria archaeon]|nr:molybdopterin-dependent oxidoreductase [Nitrososphaeria archaeon]